MTQSPEKYNRTLYLIRLRITWIRRSIRFYLELVKRLGAGPGCAEKKYIASLACGLCVDSGVGQSTL